jgi:hypothetical protein
MANNPDTPAPTRTFGESNSSINLTIQEWSVSLNAQAYLSDTPDQYGAKAQLNLYLTEGQLAEIIQFNNGAPAFNKTNFSTSVRQAMNRQRLNTTTGGSQEESFSDSFRCVSSDITQGVTRNLVEDYLLSVSKSLFNNVDAFVVTAVASREAVAKELFTLGSVAMDNILDTWATPAVASKIIDEVSAVRELDTSNDYLTFIEGDTLSFSVLINPPPMQSKIIAGANVRPRAYILNMVCDNTRGHASTGDKCVAYSAAVETGSQPLIPTYNNIAVVSVSAPTGDYSDEAGCDGYSLEPVASTGLGHIIGVTGYTADQAIL